jgi:hypothetical protein
MRCRLLALLIVHRRVGIWFGERSYDRHPAARFRAVSTVSPWITTASKTGPSNVGVVYKEKADDSSYRARMEKTSAAFESCSLVSKLITGGLGGAGCDILVEE